MTTNNLTKQAHWDKTYEKLTFFKPSNFDPIVKIIKKHIRQSNDKTAFEIGCFPGRYLSVFGDLGYTLNGIDLTPRVKVELPEWLKNCGYRVGKFYLDDFTKFTNKDKYSIVCSFGFIEHFLNYHEIIKKHMSYVDTGGYLIITAPNFNGSIQNKLHSIFDKENLKLHYLPAMNPFEWKQIIESEGFKIIYCGWFGGFDFWAEKKGNGLVGNAVIKLLNFSGKLLRFIPWNNPSFSPYSAIVAIKINHD